MARSTICMDRADMVDLDAWAAKRGLPSGPGYRRTALTAILRHVVHGEPLPEVDDDGRRSA